MNQEHKQALAHVLWIGGATDTGKTTVSRILAARNGLRLYNYDQRDLAHVKRLAETKPRYQAALTDPLDERWVWPEPEQLTQRTLQTFRDRFPLVLEELVALPGVPMIVAEGFGFTPELLSPILLSKRQAVWLVPTEEFKCASMARRRKPSFRDKTSDPDKATSNVLARDMLLTEQIRAQAQSHDLTVFEVDGSRSAEEMARLVERYFEPFAQAFRGV